MQSEFTFCVYKRPPGARSLKPASEMVLGTAFARWNALAGYPKSDWFEYPTHTLPGQRICRILTIVHLFAHLHYQTP